MGQGVSQLPLLFRFTARQCLASLDKKYQLCFPLGLQALQRIPSAICRWKSALVPGRDGDKPERQETLTARLREKLVKAARLYRTARFRPFTKPLRPVAAECQGLSEQPLRTFPNSAAAQRQRCSL